MELIMRYKIFMISGLVLLSLLSFGCRTAEIPVERSETDLPASNTTPASEPENTEKKEPLKPETTPEIATTNNAPTITPVVREYCRAMFQKDEAALRKIYSSDTLRSLEKDMMAENKKSLVEFLSEVEPITDVSKCSARNEMITGDTAIAEIQNENMPNGIKVRFVKENGQWKITNLSPETDLR